MQYSICYCLEEPL